MIRDSVQRLFDNSEPHGSLALEERIEAYLGERYKAYYYMEYEKLLSAVCEDLRTVAIWITDAETVFS